jgi:large subunit ribosomal protein L13
VNITKPTTASEIKRNWHLVDVKDQIIGHVAGEIALLLMGKNKSYFAKNMDCGDYVVVINSDFIKSTGNKEEQKLYRKHSMYPGGYKEITLEKLRIKKSEVIVEHAVKGMLPDNKLKSLWLKKLYIFPKGEHKYKDKFIK